MAPDEDVRSTLRGAVAVTDTPLSSLTDKESTVCAPAESAHTAESIVMDKRLSKSIIVLVVALLTGNAQVSVDDIVIVVDNLGERVFVEEIFHREACLVGDHQNG